MEVVRVANDMLTAQQIRELMEKATKGPWVDYGGFVHTEYEYGEEGSIYVCGSSTKDDSAFIAALPDIAQTALDLYAKVEELEKEKARCLEICQDVNGLPYCKNCGLGSDASRL